VPECPLSVIEGSVLTEDGLRALEKSAILTGTSRLKCRPGTRTPWTCGLTTSGRSTLGHVPRIDHNPRKGEKIEFAPHEAQRYKTRTQVERANSRLKGEFGAEYVRVRGHAKVTLHLMLGVLVLAADQLLRLIT
jgi:hypothetical protein